MICSIHRGGQALASTFMYSTAGQFVMTNVVELEEASPGTSAVTYSVRLSGYGAATAFELGSNGGVGSRRLGGALCASLIVEEIVP